MKLRATLCVFVSMLLAEPLLAAGNNYGGYHCRPVGTWLINVEFPDVPTPTSNSLKFQQLLVLNADRTLQESNNGLHPNSTPLTAPTAAPPTTGSDGFGTWKRKRGCRIQFTFYKFLFAGDAGMPPMNMPADAPPMAPPPKGFPIGFFKVSGIAKISGHSYSSEEGDVKSEFIFGSDPFSPEAIRIDAGDSFAGGMRLFPTD